jgi:DNA polymerase-3 subunit beta
MHLKMSSEELALAMARVRAVAKSSTTIPIYSSVLLRAEGGTLTVTAFDGDLAAVSEHAAEVRDAGACCVDAKALAGIASALPDGAVELSAETASIEIRSGRSRWKLGVQDAANYPPLPKSLGAKGTKVDAAALAQAISRVAFAASSDGSRLHLNSVCLISKKGQGVLAVSTDGNRLALSPSDLDAKLDWGTGRLVPRPAALILQKTIEAAPEAETFLAVSPDGVTLRQPGLAITTRLLDGTFPEYEHVVPKSSPKVVKVERVAFAEALKRIRLLAPDATWAAIFDLSDGRLQISLSESNKAGAASRGLAEEVLDVDYRGKPLLFSCNPKYLGEALDACPGDQVRLELDDESSPVVIKPLEDAVPFFVTMPQRL